MENKKTGWLISPLKKVIQLKSGTTIPNELEKKAGEIPFVRISDFNLTGNEYSIHKSINYADKFKGFERQLIPVNSIIFPKRGGAIATNKKRLTTIPILIDLNTMAAICKPELDPDFFFCWFSLIDLGKLDGASSSVPQINNDDIYGLSIYYPKEIKEQKNQEDLTEKIISTLKTLSEKNNLKCGNLIHLPL
jgi:type I restriction enzyme S subunit